jgi:hypothetical protein
MQRLTRMAPTYEKWAKAFDTDAGCHLNRATLVWVPCGSLPNDAYSALESAQGSFSIA